MTDNIASQGLPTTPLARIAFDLGVPHPVALQMIKRLADDGLMIVPLAPRDQMLTAARDWSYAKYGKPIGNSAAIGCWNAMASAARVPLLERPA